MTARLGGLHSRAGATEEIENGDVDLLEAFLADLDRAAARLERSWPEDGATDVSCHTLIALTFTTPLDVVTAHSSNVGLIGPWGSERVQVVAAAGRIPFVREYLTRLRLGSCVSTPPPVRLGAPAK